MRFALLAKRNILVFSVFLTAMSVQNAHAESRQAVHDRIENLLGAADDFDVIFAHLKEVFASANSDQIVEITDMVEFPFTVNGGDGKVIVKDESEFTDNIDDLIPDNVRKAVAKQRYEDLSISSDGVMFGNGEFWMNAICDDNACANPYWAVTAINR